MIKVLSYGSGNVKAITRIFSGLNLPCEIASCASDLKSATRLILPGVGAFDQTMALLKRSGMLSELNRMVIEHQVPILGVCVGMQVMANSSEEGTANGLGWIDGHVAKLDTSQLAVKPYLPHMGWNSIEPQYDSLLLKDVDEETGFYFLHSFRFVCSNEKNVLATTEYGEVFCSAVACGNIFGFQFHPEKSHQNGIRLFRNFANL